MNLIDILAKRLPLSRNELLLLILTAPNRYKVHTIEKRHNRGKRIIAQPTAEIKLIQKIIQRYLSEKLPIHDCAKAYRRNTSIKDHATPHAPHNFLLKIDFKDFFASIKSKDFSTHLEKLIKIDQESAEIFARIFFWRPKGSNNMILATGAPSSPWVSNTILIDFDTRVADYCHSVGVVYTRYADDLAFSTNNANVLSEILLKVRSICTEIDYPKLIINEEKTVFTSKKHNRTLVGLVLSNDGAVSIGRDRKREIRALAKNYDKGQIQAEQISHLRGLLSFTISIDKSFNASIERMIGPEKYSKLMKD